LNAADKGYGGETVRIELLTLIMLASVVLMCSGVAALIIANGLSIALAGTCLLLSGVATYYLSIRTLLRIWRKERNIS
jgi:hypothetical protein